MIRPPFPTCFLQWGIPMRERTSGRTVGGFRNVFLQGPAVTLLLLWMLVPLGMTLWFSFQRYNLINPMISGFAGWDNYTYLLTDPALWTAMGNTLLLVAHNPGIAAAAAGLLQQPPEQEAFDRYPSGATTVMDFAVECWAEVAPSSGLLHAFTVPKQLF